MLQQHVYKSDAQKFNSNIRKDQNNEIEVLNRENFEHRCRIASRQLINKKLRKEIYNLCEEIDNLLKQVASLSGKEFYLVGYSSFI